MNTILGIRFAAHCREYMTKNKLIKIKMHLGAKRELKEFRET